MDTQAKLFPSPVDALYDQRIKIDELIAHKDGLRKELVNEIAKLSILREQYEEQIARIEKEIALNSGTVPPPAPEHVPTKIPFPLNLKANTIETRVYKVLLQNSYQIANEIIKAVTEDGIQNPVSNAAIYGAISTLAKKEIIQCTPYSDIPPAERRDEWASAKLIKFAYRKLPPAVIKEKFFVEKES